MSPSVYETGRLVTLAPGLTGHTSRLDFLLRAQDDDGSWGGPDGYSLVPTLSATEALLAAARSGGEPAIARAADRGLQALLRQLSAPGRLSIPDTPAIEIIVPALVDEVNEQLRRLAEAPVAGLTGRRDGARLPMPSGVDADALAAVRAAVQSGAAVPVKLLHSLEITGDLAPRVAVALGPPGAVGASPAATAAWLGNRPLADGRGDATRFLETVVRRYGGPVPSVIPVTAFERSWVLNALARGGFRPRVPVAMVAGMAALFGPDGTPGGAGLPPDADTTSAVLAALARLGDARGVEALWAYETETHFVTWHGERSASTTTNAHVLEALGGAAATGAGVRERSAVTKVSRWLGEQQHPAGYWLDKWHASPYYATACCAIALRRYGGEEAEAVVRKSVGWLLDTQRADGSWGRWRGTAEETAYAIQVLALVAPDPDRCAEARARGYAHLLAALDQDEFPPLWHDKDLYAPNAVIRAEILAALRLAERDGARIAAEVRKPDGVDGRMSTYI